MLFFWLLYPGILAANCSLRPFSILISLLITQSRIAALVLYKLDGISVWTQSKVLESNVTFVVKFIHQSGMTMNHLRQKILHRVELSNSKVCQFEVFCAGFFASFPSLSNSWTMKMWLYFIFHKCLFIYSKNHHDIIIYDLTTISLTF